MHEAGLAASLANAIVAAGLETGGPDLRVVVHGGHDDPHDFDASLRLHLAARLPALDGERLTIAHAPSEALCADCARPFIVEVPTDACPSCGGAPLIVPRPERLELEWGAPCA